MNNGVYSSRSCLVSCLASKGSAVCMDGLWVSVVRESVEYWR